MTWVKRFIVFLVVGFALFYLIAYPEAAASAVRAIFHSLAVVLRSILIFFQSLPLPNQPTLSVTETTSAGVSLIPAAATFSSKWITDPVPGIGRIAGDRASSQASTICRGVAL